MAASPHSWWSGLGRADPRRPGAHEVYEKFASDVSRGGRLPKTCARSRTKLVRATANIPPPEVDICIATKRCSNLLQFPNISALQGLRPGSDHRTTLTQAVRVGAVVQSITWKRARAKSARAPSYYDYENNFLLYELFLTRGSPRSKSLIAKQAMGQAWKSRALQRILQLCCLKKSASEERKKTPALRVYERGYPHPRTTVSN